MTEQEKETQNLPLLGKLVQLFEKNLTTMHKLGDRFEHLPNAKYTPQKAQTLLHIQRYGRSRLKDMATHMGMSTPALCLMFNKLEKDGLVLRETDANDRRNTFYSATEKGNEAANEIIAKFRSHVALMFNMLSQDEMQKFIDALTSTNEILENHLHE